MNKIKYKKLTLIESQSLISPFVIIIPIIITEMLEVVHFSAVCMNHAHGTDKTYSIDYKHLIITELSRQHGKQISLLPLPSHLKRFFLSL